jgi:hypothetical protein
VQIDKELRAHPDAAELYTEARFVYFLERLEALYQRLSADQATRRMQDKTIGAATSVREAALKARKRLERRLQRFAGKRGAELDEIAKALGTAETDERLAASLTSLAALAQRWMALSDDVSKRLAKNAGLTSELAGDAEKTAKALAASGAGAALAGPRAGRDSPLVNREEGAVLLEMEEAMGCFEEAHEENPAVKRLVPGPSVRHALGVRKRTREGSTEEGGEAAELEAKQPSDGADKG